MILNTKINIKIRNTKTRQYYNKIGYNTSQNNIIIDVIMELSKNKNIINKKTIDETIYEKINL